MPDYLSKKDWRSLIDQKQYKSVKKTGISETLDTLSSAVKKDDPGAIVSAAEGVIDTATKVKGQQKAYPDIVKFLDSMISAAKSKQGEMQRRVGKIDEDDDDEASGDLGKALKKVRQLGEDKAWNFVLAPGKPSSGLVLSKRTIKKGQIATAFEMKGKRGPFFLGKVFGEGGKYVLLLDEAPPAGLAKAAKNAALLHAQLNIKILVRGGGVELDGDTDLDTAPGMDDGDLPVGDVDDDPKFAIFKQRIGKVSDLFDKIKGTPAAKQEGGLDGVTGILKQLTGLVNSDPDLEDEDKVKLQEQIDAMLICTQI